MKKYFIGIGMTIAGVILGGLVLKMGHENDWPIVKDAAKGFDN